MWGYTYSLDVGEMSIFYKEGISGWDPYDLQMKDVPHRSLFIGEIFIIASLLFVIILGDVFLIFWVM